MQANAQPPPAPPHSPAQIQYPRCIECVSKWYRKTIQYRSPDGAKNVSCLYRTCIEQKVSRYCTCIERCISKITIHVRYTSIHFDTLRYIYGENAPRYMGKKAPSPNIVNNNHDRGSSERQFSPPGAHP